MVAEAYNLEVAATPRNAKVCRSVLLAALSCTSLWSLNANARQAAELVVSKQFPAAVLTINSVGAEGNKYGFEGGRVVKLKGTYHLFTSEMVGDPHWVKMRLAHWTSTDRLNWKRQPNLAESSGDYTGKDQRAALWSPLPVYDSRDNRWNLF